MSLTRKIFLFIGLPLIIVFAVVIGWAFQANTSNEAAPIDDKNATACAPMASPVDVTLATAILYPGQERGGDYKPHGGFRFDDAANKDITVTVPLDAKVTSGSRYIEQGEVQYMFDFKSGCGLDYRFDHLKTLSAKFQAIADKLPEAKVDDSRTTAISPALTVTAGETIASAVGFTKGDNGPNVFVDFGVYDRRQKNTASQDSAWATKHVDEQEQAFYAVCWLDLLPAADSAIVKDLPGGDSIVGKTSDYCK